jgi:anti-sigma regulatory factor (Ser/Thr protein kinase)
MLRRLRCGSERSDDLALVVSELVTNAVVHGPDADVELTLTGTPAMVRVEVRDAGTTTFDWPEQPGDVHRGLALVGIFSDRCGVTRTPSTVVWCELDLAEAG